MTFFRSKWLKWVRLPLEREANNATRNALPLDLEAAFNADTPPSADPLRLFVVAGDASGDTHAAHVVQALRRLHPNLTVEAVGGDALAAAGAKLLASPTFTGQVGLWGPLRTLPHHIGLAWHIKQHLKGYQPHGVLLVDYGGFNLRLAAMLNQRVFYFIPPQVWASREKRILTLKNDVEHVFGILPFEAPLYERYNVPYTYVGHPLIHQLPPKANRETLCQQLKLDPTQPIGLLLPGSRSMEVDYLLDPLLQAAKRVTVYHADRTGQQLQWVLAKADTFVPPSPKAAKFSSQLADACALAGLDKRNLRVISGQTHALLSVADVAMGASGTVTLEAALYGTPMVVAYKAHPIVAAIARRVIQVPFLALPNLLHQGDYPIFPEFLQDAVDPEAMAEAVLAFVDKTSVASVRAHGAMKSFTPLLDQGDAATNVAKGLLALLAH
jgi:lipid-A-disaccharide synthase